MADQKICLTIAGLDPSGGAGIIADIKTFSAFGCFAAAAVSSVTFQNTTGVFGAVHQTADALRRQVDAIMDDLDVAAVKTGMLPTRETIETTATIAVERGIEILVVDPVVRSTSGYDLIDDEALKVLTEKLFPLSLVVTPNKQEAERIAGMKIETAEDIETAARLMLSMGARNVLIKGGHFAASMATDHLFGNDGTRESFSGEFIETTATHGTGCTLAAAITANLALGHDLARSVAAAKEFVTAAIRTAQPIGRGHSPINILSAAQVLPSSK